eukprot:tig00000944_g5951.t1
MDEGGGFSDDLFLSKEAAGGFTCAVCLEIAREPLSLHPCEHVYCTDCAARLRTCPQDNQRIDRKKPLAGQLLRMYKNLQLRCPLVKTCKWTGALGDLQEHLSLRCSAVPVPCPYPGCPARVPRGGLEAHASGCQFRTVACQHCGAAVPALEARVHLDACPELPVECPHGPACGRVPRSRLAGHQQACPQAPAECFLRELGCPFAGRRADVEAHLAVRAAAEMRVALQRAVAGLEEARARLAGAEELLGRAEAERDAAVRALSEQRSSRERAEARTLREVEGYVSTLKRAVVEKDAQRIALLDEIDRRDRAHAAAEARLRRELAEAKSEARGAREAKLANVRRAVDGFLRSSRNLPGAPPEGAQEPPGGVPVDPDAPRDGPPGEAPSTRPSGPEIASAAAAAAAALPPPPASLLLAVSEEMAALRSEALLEEREALYGRVRALDEEARARAAALADARARTERELASAREQSEREAQRAAAAEAELEAAAGRVQAAAVESETLRSELRTAAQQTEAAEREAAGLREALRRSEAAARGRREREAEREAARARVAARERAEAAVRVLHAGVEVLQHGRGGPGDPARPSGGAAGWRMFGRGAGPAGRTKLRLLLLLPGHQLAWVNPKSRKVAPESSAPLWRAEGVLLGHSAPCFAVRPAPASSSAPQTARALFRASSSTSSSAASTDDPTPPPPWQCLTILLGGGRRLDVSCGDESTARLLAVGLSSAIAAARATPPAGVPVECPLPASSLLTDGRFLWLRARYRAEARAQAEGLPVASFLARSIRSAGQGIFRTYAQP